MNKLAGVIVVGLIAYALVNAYGHARSAGSVLNIPGTGYMAHDLSSSDVEADLIRSRMGYYQMIRCGSGLNGWDYVCSFRRNSYDGSGAEVGVAVDRKKIVAVSREVTSDAALPVGPTH